MKPQIEITPLEWDTIETYLDHNDVSEKDPLLNEKLAQIPDVNNKIEQVKIIREEIENSIRQSKIKEFHEHVSVDEKDSRIKNIANQKKQSKTIWYAIAAALIVLFGVFWMMDNTTPSEKIFAKNFKPDIGLPLKMGSTNSYSFYEGMVNYKQENYKEAIIKWDVLLKVNPENDTLNYFMGVANLALGNADKSLEYLQNQEHFKEGVFREDAAYYAALAKIKEGEFEEAKVFLKNNPSDRNIKLLKVLNEQ